MPEFTFRCGEDHTFRAKGKYSHFDMARKCARLGCDSPAFMIVEEMAGMALSQQQTDEWSYMQHNITYTGGDAQVQHKPNEQSMQCQCEQCCGHRRRNAVTGVAEPARKNRRVAKEVRLDSLEKAKKEVRV